MNSDYLSALALLKISYDEYGATYVDYITPFVGDTIRATGLASISSEQIRTALTERYGIIIPNGVLNTITRRLSRRGFGHREHHRFIPDPKKLSAAFNFDNSRLATQRAIDDLAGALVEYSKVHTNYTLSTTEAVAGLIKYADNNGLPILETNHTNTTLETSLTPNEIEFIVSKFAIHVFEHQLPEWDTLVMLAKGSKLASVLYLPDPRDSTRKIERLTALFDTPTLLSALGYQGTTQEKAARDLLDIAYGSGVTLGVFDHTVDEIDWILNTVSEHIHHSPTSRPLWGVSAHFFERGYTASDIELLRGRLDDDLRSLKLQTIDRPDISIEMSVNENHLESTLQDGVNYMRREPLLHDLDAVTAVFRLRHGRLPRSFEFCRVLFVTPNGAMARSAREFFHREYGAHWPPAITDDDFATLLWLKQPMEMPNLPARRIVADAYAALEPGLVVWEKFVNELDKLHHTEALSYNDYYHLKYSKAAQEVLMQVTLGQPSGIDSSKVQEIIARVTEDIQAPLREELLEEQSELSKLKEASEERERILERDIASIRSELVEARADRDRALGEYDRLFAQRRASARKWAAALGTLMRWMVVGLGVLAFVAGSWLGLRPEWAPQVPDTLAWRVVGIGLVLACLLVTAAATLTDWKLSMLGRRIEVRLSRWLEAKFSPEQAESASS